MNHFPAPINLATQPFRRERALGAVLVAGCTLLTLSLVVFTILYLHERHQAAALKATIHKDQAQLAQLQRQQAQFQGVLGKPANVDVLSKSVFYNELIARRAVSWTRVLDDLGKVMPYNVRLVSMRLPQVAPEEEGARNHIQLDMTVGAEQPQAVLDLLNKLQQSPVFGPSTLISQTPPSQNDPQFHYRVSVPYVQAL